jgi:hypothetical protein
LWPIQLIVNEVNPEFRFSPENIVTVGFWFGEEPPMSIFWKPFTMEMRESNKFTIVKNDITMQFNIIPIFCTVDTVARDMMQAKNQFNGAFGCSFCLHPGVNIYNDLSRQNNPLGRKSRQTSSKKEVVAKSFNKTRYPTLPDIQLRDHDSSLRDMTIAQIEPKLRHVNGFKGLSALAALEDFDLVWGFSIDYMHNCLIGVTRQLMNLWFDSSYHNQPFYIGLHMQNIDKKLLSIKHTNEISRKTTSVKERLFWKANDCRNWLLFYGVVSLHGTLLPRYLEHFSLFCSAIYILLKSSISPEDMQTARQKLLKFYENFEVLYGPINTTYNVHLTSHLCDCVSYCGPLWAYSCFHFEDNNGILSGYVKGTRHVLKQIASKHSLNAYASNRSNFDSETVSKFNDAIVSKKRVKNPLRIENTCGVGKMKTYAFNDQEKRECILLDMHFTFAQSGQRVIHSHVVYTTCDYSDKFRMDNSYVELLNGKIVRIKAFFVLENSFYMSVFDEFEHIESHFFNRLCKHLKVFKRKERNIIVAPITQIKQKCIVVKNDSIIVFTSAPNPYERD